MMSSEDTSSRTTPGYIEDSDQVTGDESDDDISLHGWIPEQRGIKPIIELSTMYPSRFGPTEYELSSEGDGGGAGDDSASERETSLTGSGRPHRQAKGVGRLRFQIYQSPRTQSHLNHESHGGTGGEQSSTISINSSIDVDNIGVSPSSFPKGLNPNTTKRFLEVSQARPERSKKAVPVGHKDYLKLRRKSTLFGDVIGKNIQHVGPQTEFRMSNMNGEGQHGPGLNGTGHSGTGMNGIINHAFQSDSMLFDDQSEISVDAGQVVRTKKESKLKEMKTKLKKTNRRRRKRIHSPVLIVSLVEAIRNDDIDQLEELLDKNSFNLDKLDKSNLTLLHHAALNGRDFMARALLKRGASVDVVELNTKATPLHATARTNNVNVAHVLLSQCADVDRKTITGKTPLHVSARRGFLEMTRILLKVGKADVQAVDSDKVTPLHYAAMSGSADVCRFLIDHGADICAKDNNLLTPLMRAVMSGHLHLVDMFIEKASDASIIVEDYLMEEDNEGNTCLHLAVSKRRTEVIKRLLEHDVSPNVSRKNGMGPLHIAAINGQTNIAMLLVDGGADVNLPDNEGMTPLHRSTLYNQVEMMAYLIHEGALVNDADQKGFTPLLCAAWKGHIPAGDLLLTRGASWDVFDIHHKTPLHWAAEMDHIHFIEFLLKNGGKDLLELPDTYEKTALHYAAETGNANTIKLLISFEVEGEVRDLSEKTPVHIAVQGGYTACVEELLRHTPELMNEDDKDGMTPLLVGCASGRYSTVRSLLKMGAEITNVNDDHMTALMLAAMNNHVETMSVLIENNCDINAVDRDGNTALHLCCTHTGHIAAANLLIRSGADQSISNNKGFTPLELAIEREHGEIASAIIKSKDWRIAMQSKDEQMISPMKALIEKMPDVALLAMDRCVFKTFKNSQNTSYDVKYEYQYIDPGPDDESSKENGYRYFAIRTMCQYGREKLLAHELSQSILKRKWTRFGRVCYVVDLILYLFFLGVLTAYTLLVPSLPHFGNYTECEHLNISRHPEMRGILIQDDKPGYFQFVDPVLASLAYIIIAYCVAVLTGELLQIYIVRLKYVADFGNYVDWANLISAFIFVFPPGRTHCNNDEVAGTICVFVSWIKLIMYFKQFKTTGLYVLMFLETLTSLIKAMMVYIMFVVSFVVTFNMLYWNVYRFQTIQAAFLSIMTMMLGEFNKDDLFNEESLSGPGPPYSLSFVFFLVFLFLMPMVLNNLTIGIAVGDIDEIQKKAFIKNNSIQADYVYRIENKCPIWLQRILYQPEYIMRVRKDITRTKFKNLLFPPEDAAFVEADDKSVPRSAEHVLDELCRQKASLEALKLMVRQQGDMLRSLSEKEGVVSKVQDVAALSELYDEPSDMEDDENDPNVSIA